MIYDYNLRKKHHFCVSCGKQDAYTLNGKTRCYECSEKRKQSRKLHPEWSKKNNDRVKKIRYERMVQGLCIDCGKPAEKGKLRCLKHLYKDKGYHKHKELNHYTAAYIGVCMRCLREPAKAGHKLCEACYGKSLASLEKARENADVSKYKNFRFGKE